MRTTSPNISTTTTKTKTTSDIARPIRSTDRAGGRRPRARWRVATARGYTAALAPLARVSAAAVVDAVELLLALRGVGALLVGRRAAVVARRDRRRLEPTRRRRRGAHDEPVLGRVAGAGFGRRGRRRVRVAAREPRDGLERDGTFFTGCPV